MAKKAKKRSKKAPVRKSTAAVKSLKKKKVSTFWGLFSLFTVLVLVLLAVTKAHIVVQDANQQVLSAQDQSR